jgi:hypothetical protein
MAFLSAVAAKVLQWAIAKGTAAAISFLKYLIAIKKSKSDTDKIIKEIVDAKTKEELDKAADNISNDY